MTDMIAIAGIIFGNLVIIVVAMIWWRLRQRRLELQAEVQSRLIDKFTSTPEMVAFLQSDAGREFINGVQIGAVGQSRERVLAGIRRAIVLVALGSGFAILGMLFESLGWAVPAVLCLALGAGNILATVVSMSVGRRLGMTFDGTPSGS